MLKLRRWKLGGALLAGMLVSACGGGSDEAKEVVAQPLSVSYQVQPAVRQLSAAEQVQVDLSQPDHVELATALAAKTGDVIVSGDTAFKLGAAVAPTGSGKLRFVREQPSLQELFTSLVLDGEFNGLEVPATAAGDSRPRALSSTRALDLQSKCQRADVDGLGGASCSFEQSLGNTPLSFKGSAGVGIAARFSKWDLIVNSGAGTISLSATTTAEVVSSFSDEAKEADKVGKCRASGATSAGQFRAAVFSIPTSIPGFSIAVPMCLYLSAQTSLDGKLFAYTGARRIDIAVGGGEAPRIVNAAVPAGTSSGIANTATFGVGGTQDDQLKLVPVELDTQIEAGIQVGLEPTAFRISFAGLESKTAITASGKARFAGAVIGKLDSVNTLSTARLYCLDIGVRGHTSLTGFVETPALWKRSTDVAATLGYEFGTWPLFETEPRKIGNCDFKVRTEVAVSATPAEASLTKVFDVQVIRNDPDAGKLWEDLDPTGAVTVRDATGKALCVAALSTQGKGKCTHKYLLPARVEMVKADYAGDAHYDKTDKSNAASVTIDLGAIVYSGESVGTGSCNDSNVTSAIGGSLVPTDTLGVKRFSVNDNEYLINVPGTTSATLSYPEAEGSTTETVNVSFSAPTAEGSGTFGGGGSYTYTNQAGTFSCAGSYTFTGTYSY